MPSSSMKNRLIKRDFLVDKDNLFSCFPINYWISWENKRPSTINLSECIVWTIHSCMKRTKNKSAYRKTMNRLQLYKHHGKDFDDLRRRRNETNISLRKVFSLSSRCFLFILVFFCRTNVMNKSNLNVI